MILYIMQLSINNRTWLSIRMFCDVIYNFRKRTGPNMDYWGTPDKTSCDDEQKPLTITCCECFIKKALIQFKRFLLNP